MKLTVTSLSDDILTLDVSEDLELENFKALCESETGIPASQMAILYEGRPLTDPKKKLSDYGLKDNDVILMQHLVQPQNQPRQQGALPFPMDFSQIQVPQNLLHGSHRPTSAESSSIASEPFQQYPQSDDPEHIRQMFLSNPEQLSLLKQNNPRLAEALLSGDLEQFDKIRKEQMEQKAEKDRQRIRMLNADPFDSEAQKLIAEEIRLKNIDMNMETAMEYHPESFGQVVMLYIDCKVNNHPVKAFIDSGAQTTIMSQACAERCSIMRLVDVRWAGVAKGVGTQKIIGRVHLGQIQIGNDFLTSSFSILEEQPMDMLLGLDMLKRHQCCIDLKNNLLKIGTTGTVTPFLSESDLPECTRQSSLLGGMSSPSRLNTEVEDQQLAEALQKSAHEVANPDSAGCSGTNPHSYREEDVKHLENMGFERTKVIEELIRCNGDATKATAALFAKSIKF
ncbi:DDI2 (predicted) [Pycnogonum litorale]